MRLSLAYGTLLSALIINARIVVTSSRGVAFQDTRCNGNKCSVTAVPVDQRSDLHARVVLPKPGKPEGEPGEEGGSGAGGEGAPGSSNNAGDDSDGGAGSDGRWGEGGAGAGETGDEGQQGNAAFVDDDLTPSTLSPPATEAEYDTKKAWAYQAPLPEFQDLFYQARRFTEDMAEPNKAIFWSGGDKYAVQAGQIAQLGSKISPTGLQIFNEFHEDWIQLRENAELQSRALAMDAAGQKQYWDILSAAFAKISSGDVHVLLPAEGLKGPGAWSRSEFPEIQKNEDVQRIFWIDPNYPKADPVETLVWSRTDGFVDPATHTWPLNTPFSDTNVFPLRSP